MEKAMAPHSSTLAWKIPWTEEPGRLQSIGSLRVQHDWATSLSLFTFIGGGNGNPLQCSCLENPRNGGAWWAAVSGVAQSRTRLKRLSSSSSIQEWFGIFIHYVRIIIVNLLNVTTQSYDNVIDYISYAVQLYLYYLSYTWKFITLNPLHLFYLSSHSPLL